MIEVKNLTKRYGDHAAIEDLSFTVEDGKIYGFLGPNGAGKSTTMNILTGCLAATSGEVNVDGFDIFEDATEAKKRIGYLPEIPPVYTDRTIYEYLAFVARAKGVSEMDVADEVYRVMDVTKTTEFKDRLIKNLSKGYRQRVGIAQALLGSPKVIILDEPTVGLDPHQIIEIRELISGLKGKHTVILSSHILSEVQAVCEEILIISKGHMVACDTTENLEKMFSGSIKVSLEADGSKEEIEALLKNFDGARTEVKPSEKEEGISLITVEIEGSDDRELCRRIFRLFSEKGIAILQMSTTKASLEDVFIELTATQNESADAPKEKGEAE